MVFRRHGFSQSSCLETCMLLGLLGRVSSVGAEALIVVSVFLGGIIVIVCVIVLIHNDHFSFQNISLRFSLSL